MSLWMLQPAKAAPGGRRGVARRRAGRRDGRRDGVRA